MKNINKKTKRFTLIELLVSMGVFSILLVLSMSFFTSAQKMWVTAEEKNELYSDARIIMDLLSSQLQSLHYQSDNSNQMPLEIGCHYGKNYNNYIIFTALSKGKFDKEDDDTINIKLFAISEKNTNGGLAYLVLTNKANGNIDKLNDFMLNFPPYGKKNGNHKYASFEAAMSGIKIDFDSEKAKTILSQKNITKLNFICKDKNFQTISGKQTTPPYLLEIELTLMSKSAFKNYQTMQSVNAPDLENYKKEHEFTFKRAIFLSERWSNN